MITLLLLAAVAAGAYWAGTRHSSAGHVRLSHSDDAAQVPTNVDPSEDYGRRARPWLLVGGLVLAAVLLLSLLFPAALGIGPIGGPGGLFGP
jgi:hypothetical protein